MKDNTTTKDTKQQHIDLPSGDVRQSTRSIRGIERESDAESDGVDEKGHSVHSQELINKHVSQDATRTFTFMQYKSKKYS